MTMKTAGPCTAKKYHIINFFFSFDPFLEGQNSIKSFNQEIARTQRRDKNILHSLIIWPIHDPHTWGNEIIVIRDSCNISTSCVLKIHTRWKPFLTLDPNPAPHAIDTKPTKINPNNILSYIFCYIYTLIKSK